jgi:peptidoglycan/xylan/chitin deacetylase (PgdA/CDA1 family)
MTSEAVTQDQLERQLGHLKRRGWRTSSFREAAQTPQTQRTMVITFDDALRSVKQLAFPVLESLGLTATVFAPTAYVSSGEHCAWSGLDRWMGTPHADELLPMSWSDLAELAERSWEIGSHTCTHPHLTRLDNVTLRRELEESREASVSHLGYPLATVAYPYGDADERVAAFAERAGYEAGAGLASDLRLLGRYRYPRIGIYHRDRAWRFRVKTTPVIRRARASRGWGTLKRDEAPATSAPVRVRLGR